MEEEELKAYKKSAFAWKKAISFARKKAKEGKLLLKLAEEIEKLIKAEGAEPAFPVNLSRNEEAAHFTPKWNDAEILKESDLLSIDIGTSVEGFICDGAISINLDNKYAKQIGATELALENGISKIGFGKSVDDVGKEIERTLKEKGLNPVYNLGGHGLAQYDIHGEPSVPNHSSGNEAKFEEGVIAIEPFSSTGDGFVGETPAVEIFAELEGAKTRNIYARKLLEFVKKYEGLPFAERWIRKESRLNEFQASVGLRDLMKNGCFETFPGLKEAKGGIIAQAEKTVIVLEGEAIVLGEK
ncbi:MAG: type II methionyl aminopeptidase [Candidatus Diapherotrites archaeon]|nr:type II methionyl aminopeptidase [Candidatus Diapherotrites archaeon]